MVKFSIQDWFQKKEKERKKPESGKLDIPGHLWVKCYKCENAIFNKDLENNQKVCPKCNYHFKLSAKERLALTLDQGTFVEYATKIRSKDFLGFVDTQPYHARLKDAEIKSGLLEAIVVGEGKISEMAVAIGAMDFSFMGGSMGSAVGEKFTLIAELAIEHKIPLIIFSSSGGARMQESIMSLMQMAKTSAALGRLKEMGIPYISVCTDPTTGGTTASFAMLGDINIAEPQALIGFAGQRVIEQTIRQKLPEGFQRSEYLLEHGMIDMVVSRKDMKETLAKILRFFLSNGRQNNNGK